MSRRAVRIAEMMKRELGTLISQDIQDPRLGFVTVINVKCTDDLRNAKVHVSVLGGAKEKKVSMAILEKTKGFLRGRVGDLLQLRFVPEILFVIDDTLDKIEELENMFALIRQPHEDVRPKRGRPRKNPKSA